ncbi:MAG: TonB-dependent receptor [Bacteroidetes bacterium]|nr:TonB-dependent receptor [Bacteroidota bacterium]
MRLHSKLKIAVIVYFLSLSSGVYAQSVEDIRMDGTEAGKPLIKVLSELEQKYPVQFFYLSEWLEPFQVEQSHKGLTVVELLRDLFKGTELDAVVMDPHYLVIVKDPRTDMNRKTLMNVAARAQKSIEKVQVGDPRNVKKGATFILRGKITDGGSGQALVNASVSVSDLQQGTTTDGTGQFEIKIPAGSHVVSFSYLNYEEKIVDLGLYADGEMKVILEEQPTILDEVVVSDVAANRATTSRVGQTQISIREIKRAPSLLGEADLIKQIQVLPGVTTAGEAASGFNVRGGGVDQNLILYDGIPIFNSSHAFGFFSAFNSQAIRDVSFYKGGIPAEYGGRISSVLDIRSREGDGQKWNGSGGIGLISSNLLLNGPIVKDKTTLSISARSTYSDWLINTIKTNYADLQNSTVLFYDGAVKMAHQFSPNTKLTASYYASRDEFRLQGDTTYSWRNQAGSIRLDHQFDENLSANLTLGVGSYSYALLDQNPGNGFNLSYRITYPMMKAEFHLQRGKHRLTFGDQLYYYDFNPGTLSPSSPTSNIANIQMEKQYSVENAVFAGDAINLGEKYFLEGGVRFSSFSAKGPASVYTYEPGQPKSVNTITDTLHFAAGQNIKTYFGIEPRLALRYSLSSNTSIKASYQRTYQYLHLVTNTTAVMPIDIWQPSGYYFKPQHADQLSLGWYHAASSAMYEFSIEGYYKLIQNLLDFKDGARLILNSHLETDLLQGKGRTYGVELSANKVSGRLTGSVNYTYSRSLRTISGPTSQESVNDGAEYPSNFDQPNIVNLTWKYGISRRIFFTGFFTYHTGRPVTIPLSVSIVDNTVVANFSDRNAYRIPDYNRLDLALVFEGNHKRKKFWDGTWTISVYNVYGRKNPYTVFFRPGDQGALQPYQLSIIGAPLPSISYSFKF